MEIKTLRKATYVALGMILTSNAHSFSLEIDESASANTLASNVFNSGISVFDANFIGEDVQSGVFEDNGSFLSEVFGINSGVVLSSGSVVDAERTRNQRFFNSNEFGNAGSDVLTELAGAPTFDAATLSFDFQFDNNVGGDLAFDVVFASDEYSPFFSTQNNDIFSFSINGVNQAFLPSGDTVSVDSINETRNSSLFIDNSPPATFLPTEANGLTNRITFNVSGLDAGVHIAEFSIADANNDRGDSWVFFSASAFDPQPVEVPELSARGASLAIIFLISILLLMSEKSAKTLQQRTRLA